MTSYHVEIKSGKKGTAHQHARYVTRKGKYEEKDDLIDSGYGNMPDWATHDPGAFWRAADRNERVNGAAYRELVIAIPNEFTLEQQKVFVERVVAGLIQDKPFQYAIHAPDAKLGQVANTHAHVMYSDRQPDGIPRTPEMTFARYNPAAPERGGCRKASGGRSPLELRDEVIAKRKLVADIQNEMLAAAGLPGRVDHRSHRERGISRRPERHLGFARIESMSATEKAIYTAPRAGA